jgi:BioD-like phosphotransacetylase family protein
MEVSKDRIRNYVKKQIAETQDLLMNKFFTPRAPKGSKHEFLLDKFSDQKKSMNLSPEAFTRGLPKAVKRNTFRQLAKSINMMQY